MLRITRAYQFSRLNTEQGFEFNAIKRVSFPICLCVYISMTQCAEGDEKGFKDLESPDSPPKDLTKSGHRPLRERMLVSYHS